MKDNSPMDGRKRRVVGVRFKPSDRVYFFAPGNFELFVGDRVEVETDVGYREGIVVITPEQVRYSDLRGELDTVVRKIER
jgi:cell fate regulator YaaT (PSP1 superfamily)